MRRILLPAAGLAVSYLIFLRTGLGRTVDEMSLAGRVQGTEPVLRANRLLLESISVVTVGAALVVLIGVGVARGRWQRGVRAATAVLGAVVSAQVLKFALPRLDPGADGWVTSTGGSFPSGHAVIVTSVSLAVLSLASERWRRRLVGPLVAWTAVATAATVTFGWHRPGDVIGSFFLAILWHEATTWGEPAGRRLRTLVPAAAVRRAFAGGVTAPVLWWGLASAVVLGSAAAGMAAGQSVTGHRGELAYLLGLSLVLAGAGAVLIGTDAARPRPVVLRGPVSLRGGQR